MNDISFVLIMCELKIINEKGLYVWVSVKFVEIVECFDVCVIVEKDGMSVFGDLIMGLLMLIVLCGSIIFVMIKGVQVSELVEVLIVFVGDYFGEGM